MSILNCPECGGTHYGSHKCPMDDAAEAAHQNSTGKSAVISPCGKYRYRLERSWLEGNQEQKACFIMLNPSTADAIEDDPTIRRCIGFSKAWGYGGVIVVNLFAFRSTNPALLRKSVIGGVVGENNDDFIRNAALECNGAVAAWGAHGTFGNRENKVRAILSLNKIPLYYLALTKDGHPRHPLYLRSDLKPKEWFYV